MPFEILWSVVDGAWEEAAETARLNPSGSYFDRKRLAAIRLLPGRVQFRADDSLLFPGQMFQDIHQRRLQHRPQGNGDSEDPPELSPESVAAAEHAGIGGLTLVDLSLQLARMMTQGRFVSASKGSTVYWRNSDDADSIAFTKQEGAVKIQYSLLTDHWLTVAESDFVSGINEFLSGFVQMVSEYAPGLLDWLSFALLRPFAPANLPSGASSNAGWLRHRSTEAAPSVAATLDHVGRTRESMTAQRVAARFVWEPERVDWARARTAWGSDPPGSYYDTRLLVAKDLFLGRASLECISGEVELTGPLLYSAELVRAGAVRMGRPMPTLDTASPSSQRWPLLDLALQLCRRLVPGAFDGRPGPAADFYRWPDPNGWIGFGPVGGGAIIRPHLLAEMEAAVGAPTFRAAADLFLRQFVVETFSRAPETLTWLAFQPLIEYVQTSP